MSFKSFIDGSGLKILAMVRLESCEYSIVLYLLNCAASGLTELVTTLREMASLIGYSESELKEALISLFDRFIIDVSSSNRLTFVEGRQSIRVSIQYNTSNWQLDFDKGLTSQDAIVYPFRIDSKLKLVDDGPRPYPDKNSRDQSKIAGWKQVFEVFCTDRILSATDRDKAEEDAKILVETHPPGLVILLVKHFSNRIQNLSLLASSWQHYQTLFTEETEQIDLDDVRKKHHEAERKLRYSAVKCLDQQKELNLTEEEVAVLNILNNHRHPRRQLFWAYKSRFRYPGLIDFFESNLPLMLPVTTTGNVCSKKP